MGGQSMERVNEEWMGKEKVVIDQGGRSSGILL